MTLMSLGWHSTLIEVEVSLARQVSLISYHLATLSWLLAELLAASCWHSNGPLSPILSRSFLALTICIIFAKFPKPPGTHKPLARNPPRSEREQGSNAQRCFKLNMHSEEVRSPSPPPQGWIIITSIMRQQLLMSFYYCVIYNEWIVRQ